MANLDGPPRMPLLVRVLGSCSLDTAQQSDAVEHSGPPRITLTQRRILSRLALEADTPVSVEALSAAIWPGAAPQQHRQAVHNQISRLRRAFGEGLISTHSAGYRLDCPTDADDFLASVLQAEETLERGDSVTAFASTDHAIALVRGRPYADIEHLPESSGMTQMLSTALASAEELRLEAALRLTRPAWSVIEAERLLASDPLNERRQALRVRALLLAGRRGDALAAVSAARSRLRNELGVEPGPWLASAEAEALGALGVTSPATSVASIASVTRAAPTVSTDELLRGALDALDPFEANATARGVAATANRNGEHHEAVTWLTHALELSGLDAHTRLMTRIELGDAQRLSGEPGHLGTLIDAAREAIRSGDESAIAESCFALLQLGASSTSGRPIREVGTIIEHALAMLHDAEKRAPVLAAASLASSLIGVAARSRELFVEALSLAVSDTTRARLLPFAYMSLGAPADLELRRSLCTELTTLAERLEDPIAQFEAAQLRFSVGLQQGDGAEARSAVAGMARTLGSVGDTGRQWALLFARATIAHLDGDDERCEHLATQAQRLFMPVSPARASAAHAGQLIVLRLTQGRIAELAPMLAAVVAAQPGIPAFQAAAALASAHTEPEVALSRAELALDLEQHDATWLAGHAVGARAAAILDSQSLQERYLERLLPWSGLGIWQGTCSYGPVDTALALLFASLGDRRSATKHAARARKIATRLAAKPFLRELDRAGFR